MDEFLRTLDDGRVFVDYGPASMVITARREGEPLSELAAAAFPLIRDSLAEIAAELPVLRQYPCRGDFSGLTGLPLVMAEAVLARQQLDPAPGRRRHIKITIPVNLRKTFGLETLRNFTLAVNIGFDPRLGEYSHEEICRLMYHQLAAETIPQRMAGRVSTNVELQRSLPLRLVPLPMKTLAMRLVYALSGESKGCLNISNMGVVTLPEVMTPYVDRFDFMIGVQYSYPNNCSVVSWQGKTYISMIRSIRDSELERLFFSRLVELGIPVDIESNRR